MPDRLSLPAWVLPLALFCGLWLALNPAHETLTASVEADFPVYLSHARVPTGDVSWDGFVPVGYPRLLAWAGALVDDGFRAAVALSFLGGALVVWLTYLLARRFFNAQVRYISLPADYFALYVLLLIAVFPANIHMAMNVDDFGGGWGPIIRLPFQAVFIAWAWWYTRPEPGSAPAAS